MFKYEKIAGLNCDKESNREKLDDIFEKVILKAFPKIISVDIDSLESEDYIKFLNKFYKRYKCYLSYLFFSRGNENGFSASLINCNSNKHDLICSVYARSINEALKKSICCIYFFSQEVLKNERN